jgi:hypothetical protein
MGTSGCLNCAATLDNSFRFCPSCGQKTNTHRLTFGHFLHDFFHAFTHADKGIFHLLGRLAFQPGIVAREYISGKRAKYFNPFTFFLILMSLFVLSNSYFKAKTSPYKPDARVLTQIPSDKGKQQYLLMSERGHEINSLMTRHGNVVALFAVPLFALFSYLLLRNTGYNYAEHLVANLLFVAFGNLIFTLIVWPLQSIASNTTIAALAPVLIGLPLQLIYFTWCYYQLMPASRYRLGKAFGVSLLGIVMWTLVSLTFVALYIYRSPSFVHFFARMFGQGGSGQ